MTTISYNHKEGTLSADSQVTSENVIVGIIIPKLTRVEGIGEYSGWLGLCGDMDSIPSFIRSLQGENLGANWNNIDIRAIFLTDEGPTFEVALDPVGHVVMQKLASNHAVGSGREFALGALAHGATSAEAVKIAIKHDVYSGGKVITKKRGSKK